MWVSFTDTGVYILILCCVDPQSLRTTMYVTKQILVMTLLSIASIFSFHFKRLVINNNM